MSRPTLLTAELAEEFCTLLEAGNYLETASEVCGISVKTAYHWMRLGREGREPYAAFSERVTRACARAEVDMVATVRDGDGAGVSFGKAKAAAHLLAVTRPQRFATRVNVRVREQLAEFMRFLEETLPTVRVNGAELGEHDGGSVFLQLADRWLNRQPVELEPTGFSGAGEGRDEPGEPTIQ